MLKVTKTDMSDIEMDTKISFPSIEMIQDLLMPIGILYSYRHDISDVFGKDNKGRNIQGEVYDNYNNDLYKILNNAGLIYNIGKNPFFHNGYRYNAIQSVISEDWFIICTALPGTIIK